MAAAVKVGACPWAWHGHVQIIRIGKIVLCRNAMRLITLHNTQTIHTAMNNQREIICIIDTFIEVRDKQGNRAE